MSSIMSLIQILRRERTLTIGTRLGEVLFWATTFGLGIRERHISRVVKQKIAIWAPVSFIDIPVLQFRPH